jgi:lysophospholipase L1-like esterase
MVLSGARRAYTQGARLGKLPISALSPVHRREFARSGIGFSVMVEGKKTQRFSITVIALVTATLVVSAWQAPNQAPGPTEHWVATWATAQTLYRAPALPPAAVPPQTQTPVPAPAPAPAVRPPAPVGPARRFPVPPTLARVTDQTVRMVARTSIAGQRIRVRFVNAFGATAVRIGAARVARSAGESRIMPETSRQLTFGGRPSVLLQAGQVLVSDPVDLAVRPLTDLAVSLHVVGDSGAPAEHRFGLKTTYVSQPGDFTAAPSIDAPAITRESWYWLAGIDVVAPARSATIVTFGDSITDGDQSTHGTNGAWPSMLAARLQAGAATAHLAVVNAGISGNRVLGDNNSGIVRFGADALDQPGASWITVLEGINDITGATRPGAPPSSLTADDLIAAYRQMVARAHARGIRVAGCTITPYGGSNVFSAAGEAMRQAVNGWIRTSGAFDAVIDFDAAVRDPRDPARMRAEADSPDFLHPGDAGYRLMAEAIDLSIFTRSGRSVQGAR